MWLAFHGVYMMSVVDQSYRFYTGEIWLRGAADRVFETLTLLRK